MSSIIVNEQRYPLATGATVLDTLLEAGLDVSYGCRAGACQSCMVRASAGEIPAEAQQGLKETLKAEGWFLACRCIPSGELSIDLNGAALPRVVAEVVEKRLLSSQVMGLWLKPEQPLGYRAGQFITLWRDGSTGRSYSLASLQGQEEYLELHVARVDEGAVSPWVHDRLEVGDRLDIEGPQGECFYVSGEPEQPLLLVGTGTGLSPLYGVARDALHAGHRGPIHLFHGARSADHLYYRDELRRLATEHDNFHYHPSLLQPEEGGAAEVEYGPIDRLVSGHLPKLDVWRVYLSGAPDIVRQLRKQCFLSGANSKSIHTDPFG
jgi:NAD(P)H-flavin reductase